jgi:hypothetical protein
MLLTGAAPAGLTLGISPARQDRLTRRVQLLVTATIAYNVMEALVAVTAGTIASSSALLGFGLDSVIEVSSAAAVAWQFSARDNTRREARERTALRVTAVSFFALAALVSVDSLRSLLGAAHAGHSAVGIALAGLSLLVMPVLSTAQRRAGRQLGSASAVADSKQTLLCTYLSGAPAARPARQPRAGLVVGRPDRRAGDRRGGRQGRPRRLARRHLLPRTHVHRRGGLGKNACQ